MNIIGKNVLITGGASGIGRIMGRICLEKGAANLIIWDINRSNIDITEAELGHVRPKVKAAAQGHISSYIVNVASPDEIALTYEKVKKEVGQVDILINCAGIVRGNRTFDKQTIQDIDLTMDINANAPMYVALAILPDML